jgi:hypothetical protein
MKDYKAENRIVGDRDVKYGNNDRIEEYVSILSAILDRAINESANSMSKV